MSSLLAPDDQVPPEYPFWVLLRYRAAQLRNSLDQQLREAPGRAFAVLSLLVLVWAGLYRLLTLVLQQVGRWELVALVAKQYIFVHFFLVLAIMLAFSNAVLAFTTLFGRREAGHLLGMPVASRQVVCLKWLEGMLLSSWSFLLLGVPLMLAIASTTRVHWYYYPLFIGHFFGFVVIPSTFGLLAAWAVAMWAPRRALTVLLWCGGILAVIGLVWAWRMMQHPGFSERWLDALYTQLNIAKSPLLPSTWTAKGIVAVLERRLELSLLYLAAVLSNGLFLAWVTVNILGGHWDTAYSRARLGRARALIHSGWFTEKLAGVFFPYLTSRMRVLMLKDLRGFARDATQWLQMLIMLGLLVLYAVNLKRLPLLESGNPGMRVVLAFLNLTVVSLILATFTSRFVFPLLSLESQQLWILGLLPIGRNAILLVKFAFSLTVTGLCGLAVVLLSANALALPFKWVWVQGLICLGICTGLSGLSVGLGARFPVLGQRNPARIAAGFGGTLNLIMSMLFVSIEMVTLSLLAVRGFDPVHTGIEDVRLANWAVFVLPGFGVIVAVASLWMGSRHFRRLEV